MTEYLPTNPDTDPQYNTKPGKVIIPGSNYANEMQKFEQFPSQYGQNPGNPYVYRPFPKMLYRAQRYNGRIACMASVPDPNEYADPAHAMRAEEAAKRFTQSCQLIVQDEREMQKALEAGWRESPSEAEEFLKARDAAISRATAERNYEDRNMSEGAKREIRAAEEAVGGEHVPEVPEQPRKRRGRPPKNAA